ncbi:hypothetical protein Y032_0777g2276 [Ancylostoma ceylanicum]|uniref:Uncharacterized protein n=1 Tax=Ancylostoma ceylanicum TaxID=53326 RepID=A0A016WCQ3_9BILA|nr:hypothetical protein Y032_0777g2276 [Ancylostoma ceylanicum]
MCIRFSFFYSIFVVEINSKGLGHTQALLADDPRAKTLVADGPRTQNVSGASQRTIRVPSLKADHPRTLIFASDLEQQQREITQVYSFQLESMRLGWNLAFSRWVVIVFFLFLSVCSFLLFLLAF